MPSSAGILTQRFSVCGNWGHCNMIRNELEERHAALYKRLLMTDFLDGLEGEGSPHAGAAAKGSPHAGAAAKGSPHAGAASKGSPHAGAATKGSPHTGAATKGSPHTGAAASSGQPNMDYKAILKAIKEHEDAIKEHEVPTAAAPASSKHPWIVAWEKWAKTAPKTGHDEDLPIAEIIISLPAPASAVLYLKAGNGAHVGVKHFVEMVGCEVAADIWQKAKKQQVPGRCKAKKHQVPDMVEGEMELWEMKGDGDSYQVIFAINPEQFQKGVSIKEGMDGYFQSQCMMAFFGSLATGDAKGSAD